ncbi:MAG: cation:proton antiporter [Thaumarchaeota archaeon]|nr:cation:proton antiporter [Nitrososphaerota archaeon]
MNEFWMILLIVVFGVLSLEIGFSTAILEIVAGVIGGNLFGEISPSWMSFIANYGLLGLMFLAGLEIDRNELRKHFRRSSVLALSAYLIPFVVIFAIAFAITLNLGQSTLIAIALSTTSLALLYPLLRERGYLNLEIGHAILSAAMLVDIFSMISLSIAFSAITYLSLIFLIILILFMFHAPRVGRWLFARYSENLAEIELKFILLVLLALLFFAERVMISEAVLAFIMGFLFSEILEEHEILVEKLKGIIFAFFSPIFFFKAGSFLKFSSMSLMSLLYIVILLPAAFFSKYYASKLVFRRLFGAGEALSRFVGLSFNLRLTFGIVTALFGLELGLIPLEIYTAIITIIISSALISSIANRLKGY